MNRYRSPILFFCLFVVFAAAYGGVFLSGQFLWDDKPLILDNPLLKDGAPKGAIFSRELYPGSGTNYYRPLLVFSFLLDKIFYGFDPRGFHATNLILHAVATLLLFIFFSKMRVSFFAAFVSSAIFLLHPIQAQVVSYVSGRADSLCAIFVFSALLCYLAVCDGRKNFFYPLGLLFFVASLLTKEMAVVMPLVVLLTDVFFGRREARGKRLAPFFIFAAAYAALRLGPLNFSGGNILLTKEGFGLLETGSVQRCVLFLKSLVLYLGAFFAPVGLHMERLTVFEKIRGFDVAGVVIFTSASAGVIFRLGRSPCGKAFLSFCFAWFFLWLFPQSVFVFPSIMAEHFLYLPGVSLCFCAAFFLDGARPAVKYLASVLLIFSLAFLTHHHNLSWKDELSFFERTCELSPRSVRARDSLASLYMAQARLEDALIQYLRILAPAVRIGGEQDFMRFCADVLKKQDGFVSVKDRKARAAAFHNLGVIFERRQGMEKAAAAYRCALTLDSLLNEARNNLGILLERAGERAEARSYFRQVIDLDPQFLAAYNNLAHSYAQEGRLEEAVALWRAALAIDPGYVPAQENIRLADEILRGSADRK